MSNAEPIDFRAPLQEYEHLAGALFDAATAGDESAEWRFKWEHPKFRGKQRSEVKAAALELADARLVVARENGFETWADLEEFATDVHEDGPAAKFEEAVEAVVAGDVATLRVLLHQDPVLIRMRSSRRHHATLLHYIGANGVEGARQKTPVNAVEVATLLLDAGAEVDALADMYDHQCTTMSMLVSSCHPANAGLQVALAELLIDRGAAVEGPGSEWKSSVLTALKFGYADTALALTKRGASTDNLAVAAGLGLDEDVARLLPTADSGSRHAALALAAQHGRTEIVRRLLDAGEEPSRYNPEGYHSHSTPLHQAVWADHLEVVRLLVERGARLDLKDEGHQGTPLDWANFGGRTAIAEYLRTQNAPTE